MKTKFQTLTLATLLFTAMLFTSSCDKLGLHTDKEVKSLTDTLVVKNKATVDSLNERIAYWKDEWTGAYNSKRFYENYYDSVHYSYTALGLTSAMLGINDTVLKKSDEDYASMLDTNTYFRSIPYYIAGYTGLDRRNFGKVLENAGSLKWVFENVKVILPNALIISGKKNVVKKFASDLLPYFTLTSNPAQRAAFGEYFQKHGKDVEIDGTDTTATLSFSCDDWKAIQEKFKTTESSVLEENYTEWLFVNRHYNNANATQAGSGDAWLKVCVEILTYLKNL